MGYPITRETGKDFVNLIKDDSPKEAATLQIYATVNSVDTSGDTPIYYVDFDGAEGQEPCPVNSTIAEGELTLQEGDRVIVLVKNRQGIIIGNLDRPMEGSEPYDDSWISPLIADAKKYATSYMKFTPGTYNPVTNPNAGLVLSQNAEATSLGRNLQLMAGGIAIRNNTTDLALFDESNIYLGLNSNQSIIHMSGNKAQMSYKDDEDGEFFEIRADNLASGLALVSNFDYESENPGYGHIYKERYVTYYNDGINIKAICQRSAGGYKEAYINIGANEYGVEYGGYIEAYSTYLNLECSYINLDYVNEITINDHTSSIGTIIAVTGGTEYTSNLTSGVETWKTIASITIPAGTWVVNYRVRYQNDSSGNHVIRTYFTTSSDSTAFSDSQFGAASAYLFSNNTVVISLDEDTTYYLRGYATVAGTWYRSAASYMRIAALRIL